MLGPLGLNAPSVPARGSAPGNPIYTEHRALKGRASVLGVGSALCENGYEWTNQGQLVRCITDSEVASWLEERDIPMDPYHRGSSHPYYLQFAAPASHRALVAWMRPFYRRILPRSGALIHLTDWDHYTEREMSAVRRLRERWGEDRWLIRAPGHLHGFEEQAEGRALFCLASAFKWSCYLYSDRHRSTLLNWEGVLFDFWTDSRPVWLEMKHLVSEFQLRETQ